MRDEARRLSRKQPFHVNAAASPRSCRSAAFPLPSESPETAEGSPSGPAERLVNDFALTRWPFVLGKFRLLLERPLQNAKKPFEGTQIV